MTRVLVSFLRRVVFRLRVAARPARASDELDDELSFHLKMLTDEFRESGLDESQARAAALKQFGRPTRVREECREAWGIAALDSIARDARHSVWMMAREPASTAFAVLALALGIGLVTTMFGTLDTYLFRGPPFPAGERLVAVESSRLGSAAEANMPLGDFLFLREHQTVFDNLVAIEERTVNLSTGGPPMRAAAYSISTDFLDMLGARPHLGPGFGPTTADPGSGVGEGALVSHRLWVQELAAEPGIIGTTILVDGAARTVVGVLPDRFGFGRDNDVWLPHRSEVVDPADEDPQRVLVVGRLKDDVSTIAASEALSTLLRRKEVQSGSAAAASSIRVLPYSKATLGAEMVKQLWILQIAAVLLLLIGCINTANLLLARFSRRSQELAVRGALGARRWRIVQLIMTECAMLTAVGAIGGIGTALLANDLLWRRIEPIAPVWVQGLEIDARALLFVLLLSLVVTLVAGVAPALRASRVDLNDALREDSSTATGARLGKLSRALVAVQIGLAFALLTGAGLTIRGADRLRSLDLPYQPSILHTARLTMREAASESHEHRLAFYQALLERMQQRMSTTAVAITSRPGTGRARRARITPELTRNAGTEGDLPALYEMVSASYFDTLTVPIIAGRGFRSTDTNATLQVAVINEQLARSTWPDTDPVGKRFRVSGEDSTWLTVVGVVADLRMQGLANFRDRGAGFYRPMSQRIDNTMSVLVQRPEGDGSWAESVRAVVAEIAPREAPKGIRSFQEEIDFALRLPNVLAILFLVFGVAAVLLATVGVYGMMALSVTRRRRELGIRMALGASSFDVLRLVVFQNAALVAVGTLSGAALACLFGRWLQGAGLLADLTPFDPISYLAVLVTISLVALLATLVPGLRARSVSILEVLRYQ